jgi:hypothetical protein
MKVGIMIQETPGCCGVSQLTDFTGEFSTWSDPIIGGSGKSLKAAYKDLFKNLMEFEVDPDEHGPIFQMWFQKNRKFDDTFDEFCQAEDLRVLVETIEGCVFLGEFVNPNSGNKIMGYQWLAK